MTDDTNNKTTEDYWILQGKLLRSQGNGVPHYYYARFIIDNFGTEIKYVPELGKWYVWSGFAWISSFDASPATEAMNKAITLVAKRASLSSNEDERGWLFKAGGVLVNQSHRKNIIEAMKTESEINARATDFNKNPDLLACRNVTINLRTGESYEPQPEDMISLYVDIDYDPDADQTMWVDFVNGCHPNDTHKVKYLQVTMGYAITGHTNEEIMLFFYGDGANGKGVFTGTIGHLMNNFCTSQPAEFWEKTYGGRSGAVVANLDGPRLCMSAEMSAAKLDEEFFKWVISADTLQANPKYGKPYDFTPQAFVLMSGNSKPKITGTDNSVWRRLRMVPWEESFEGQEDFNLKARLRETKNLQGVLAWLVQGAKEWCETGIPKAESVGEATQEYRQASNPNAEWARKHFQLTGNPEDFVTNAEIAEVAKNSVRKPQGDPRKYSHSIATELGITLSKPRKVGGKVTRGLEGVRIVVSGIQAVTKDPS